MQLRVNKQISLVHVPLHQCLVLLRISTPNHQIVLTCDEPDELFEPEHFALHISDLRLFEFLKVTSSRAFRLVNRDLGCILSLLFLLMRLLPDFKVLANVELGSDSHVHIDLHDLVKVVNIPLIDLQTIRVLLIDGIEHQRDDSLLEVNAIDDTSQWIIVLGFFLDHASDIRPWNT